MIFGSWVNDRFGNAQKKGHFLLCCIRIYIPVSISRVLLTKLMGVFVINHEKCDFYSRIVFYYAMMPCNGTLEVLEAQSLILSSIKQEHWRKTLPQKRGPFE